MDYPFVKAVTESLKEGARLILLAILPVILSGINTNTGVININWSIVETVALATSIIIISKMFDRGTHTFNKESIPERAGDSMGIIPF